VKVVIAQLVSLACFWPGHWVSLLMHQADFLGHLYPVYNRLMCWSSEIEEWAGIEFIWKTPAEQEIRGLQEVVKADRQ
jgi:hypothetical protein